MLAAVLFTGLGFTGPEYLDHVPAMPLPSAASEVDVVIVGAGYAGLVAARQLQAAGVEVQVLEALEQAGGRARDYSWTSGSHTNHTLELGVALIGNEKQMPFVTELFEELHIKTFDYPVWGPGNCTGGLSSGHCDTALLCRNGNGTINSFKTLFPGIITRRCVGSSKTVAALLKVTGELMLLAKGIDVNAPWSHPKAAEWDRVTFGAWLRAQCDDVSAFNYLVLTMEPDLSTVPRLCGSNPTLLASNPSRRYSHSDPVSRQSVDSVSLLHALFMAATGSAAGGGVFDGLYAFNNLKRIRGGGGAAALKMAIQLGGRVRYGARVETIRQETGAVEVTTADGGVWRARYAVVTGAPSVVGRINFAPALPPLKQQLLRSVPMGNAVRVSAVYPWAWWRARGLSGAWGDEVSGSFVPLGMDMTPCNPSRPAECAGAPGVIQAQMQGAQADALLAMPPAARQANFTGFVSQFLGPDAVAEAEQLIAFDFRDYPTLGGGTQAHFPPGVWTSSGKALREPHGRVHFAGAEYSALRFGYLDGAIRSANATAALLLKALAG